MAVNNDLTYSIIGCAIEVHRTLGPGLLESVYEEALVMELEAKGLSVDRQVRLPIVYKGKELGNPLRLDLVVENKFIVECKAVATYNSIFGAQAMSYLKISGYPCALVINFGEHRLQDGVHRFLNGYENK